MHEWRIYSLLAGIPAFLYLVAAGIFVVMLFWGGSQPIAVGLFPAPYDNVAHFLAFSVLAVLLWFGMGGKWPLLVIGLAGAVGALDEIHQLVLPGREAELADFVADVLAEGGSRASSLPQELGGVGASLLAKGGSRASSLPQELGDVGASLLAKRGSRASSLPQELGDVGASLLAKGGSRASSLPQELGGVGASLLAKGVHKMTYARSKDLRRGRYSEIGRVYLMTSVCMGREPVFADWRLGRLVVQEFRMAQGLGVADSLAWVVMPDHFHWLCTLRQGSLARLMQRVKSRSAIAVNRATLRSSKVWQAGYHDHALREDEDIKDVARYILANPVRAGLVTRMGDYPLWDAVWL